MILYRMMPESEMRVETHLDLRMGSESRCSMAGAKLPSSSLHANSISDSIIAKGRSLFILPCSVLLHFPLVEPSLVERQAYAEAEIILS